MISQKFFAVIQLWQYKKVERLQKNENENNTLYNPLFFKKFNTKHYSSETSTIHFH